jgi:hypothetical protein
MRYCISRPPRASPTLTKSYQRKHALSVYSSDLWSSPAKRQRRLFRHPHNYCLPLTTPNSIVVQPTRPEFSAAQSPNRQSIRSIDLTALSPTSVTTRNDIRAASPTVIRKPGLANTVYPSPAPTNFSQIFLSDRVDRQREHAQDDNDEDSVRQYKELCLGQSSIDLIAPDQTLFDYCMAAGAKFLSASVREELKSHTWTYAGGAVKSLRDLGQAIQEHLEEIEREELDLSEEDSEGEASEEEDPDDHKSRVALLEEEKQALALKLSAAEGQKHALEGKLVQQCRNSEDLDVLNERLRVNAHNLQQKVAALESTNQSLENQLLRLQDEHESLELSKNNVDAQLADVLSRETELQRKLTLLEATEVSSRSAASFLIPQTAVKALIDQTRQQAFDDGRNDKKTRARAACLKASASGAHLRRCKLHNCSHEAHVSRAKRNAALQKRLTIELERLRDPYWKDPSRKKNIPAVPQSY